MVILEVAFLTVFWVWVGSALLFLSNTYLPRLPITRTPEDLQVPSEPVRFPATDGVMLEGWRCSGDPHRPWIILCHGLGANRADLLDLAAGLYHAGFSLLLFDFRGHGTSVGGTTSFGWREQRDLEGALAFLGQQPDVAARPYGIYGISMGASVALMVAAQDERIGAIAVESPYTTLEESMAQHQRLLYPLLPQVPFGWFAASAYRLRFGVWPSRVSPLKAAAQLGRRALLLIHGAQDDRMPLEGIRRLFAEVRDSKELWVVEGAGHLESFSVNPGRYGCRVAKFFEGNLGVGRIGERVGRGVI